MAKLHATEIQHRPCRGRGQGRPAQRGPFLAAFIGLLLADAAQTSADAWGGFTEGPGRRRSHWNMSISNPAGTRMASARLAAVRTWTLHGALHRRPPAALTIGCGEGAKLSVYVSFPGRVWNGDAALHYTLRPNPLRPIPPSFKRQRVGTAERIGMAEWLGGPDLVRQIARAEALHVEIEDLGFGVSEAVFRLVGVEQAVRQVESACRQGDEGSSAGASRAQRGERTGAPPPHRRSTAGTKENRQPRTSPTRDARSGSQAAPPPTATPPARRADEQQAPPPRIVEDESRAPTPQPLAGPYGAPEAGRGGNAPSPSPAAPEHADRAAETPRVPSRPEAAQPPPAPVPLAPTEPPSAPAPAPEHREPDREQDLPGSQNIPADGAQSTPGAPAGPSAAPPPVPPAPPTREEEPGEDARLRLFLQRHGPNRRGEVIYDWHRQCLEHAGVDPTQAWYLSNDALAYLDKGETDRVRLSMLISTNRDLDVPPRPITCFGTARGRELTINKTE